MKQIFILSIIMLTQNLIQAQNNKIPTETIKAFEVKFPKATNPKWEKEGEKEFEVTFLLSGQKASANFTNNGEWIETESIILETALPKGFLDNFRNLKKQFKINQIYKVERADGKSYFEIECSSGLIKKEYKLDQEGQII